MKNQSIIFKRTTLFLILLVVGCFALSPMAYAVSPPPDGGYPGGNTAEVIAACLSRKLCVGCATAFDATSSKNVFQNRMSDHFPGFRIFPPFCEVSPKARPGAVSPRLRASGVEPALGGADAVNRGRPRVAIKSMARSIGMRTTPRSGSTQP